MTRANRRLYGKRIDRMLRHRQRQRHVPEVSGPRCRQCRALLLTEQDQEIGYCYDCWAKICSMDSDGILAFVSRRFENDNDR